MFGAFSPETWTAGRMTHTPQSYAAGGGAPLPAAGFAAGAREGYTVVDIFCGQLGGATVNVTLEHADESGGTFSTVTDDDGNDVTVALSGAPAEDLRHRLRVNNDRLKGFVRVDLDVVGGAGALVAVACDGYMPKYTEQSDYEADATELSLRKSAGFVLLVPDDQP